GGHVTGVQTCALPISYGHLRQSDVAEADHAEDGRTVLRFREERVDRGGNSGSRRHGASGAPPRASERDAASSTRTTRTPSSALEIGRASWRERGKSAG